MEWLLDIVIGYMRQDEPKRDSALSRGNNLVSSLRGRLIKSIFTLFKWFLHLSAHVVRDYFVGEPLTKETVDNIMDNYR